MVFSSLIFYLFISYQYLFLIKEINYLFKVFFIFSNSSSVISPLANRSLTMSNEVLLDPTAGLLDFVLDNKN